MRVGMHTMIPVQTGLRTQPLDWVAGEVLALVLTLKLAAHATRTALGLNVNAIDRTRQDCER